MKSLSRVRLFVTPWTVAYQAPPSMGFSRQECCSGLPFPSPGDLPDPGIEPGSPTLWADALLSEPPGKLAFRYSGSLWFLFIMEVPPCGWGWSSGLPRFPGWKLVSVFLWVELDLFSLECNEVSSSEF